MYRGGHMKTIKEKLVNYNYPVRSTTVTTVLRVLMVMVISILISLLTYVPLMIFAEIINAFLPVTLLSILIQIGIQLIASLGIVGVLLAWANTVYIIRPDEVVVQKGVLSVKEKHYPLKGNEEIKVYQSFWGRLFNFGDLVIYQPLIKKYIRLHSVPEPHLYAEVIRQTKSRESLESIEEIVYDQQNSR